MLFETVDLVVKYSILKNFKNKINKEDNDAKFEIKIVEKALEIIRKKIDDDLKIEEKRLEEIEEKKKRIEEKNAI